MATHKELRRIPVLREPHHLALSPDGKNLLVGDTVGNEMLFLDPATRARCEAHADRRSLSARLQPERKCLVVNGLARNQVDIYDAATMKLVKRFPIASMPSHLAFSPDSGTVFVSLRAPTGWRRSTCARLAVQWDAGRQHAGRRAVDDGNVLVADMGTDYVAEVDPADGKVIDRIHTGNGAHQLFLSPDGKIICVNNRVAGTITVLDADDAGADAHLHDPGRPGRHGLRAGWQDLDHAALRREGRGARPGDRDLPDRCRSAARRTASS